MAVSVTVPEAAAMLGVSERTVWRRIRDGRLPSIRLGRHLRVMVDPSAAVSKRIAEVAIAYGSEAPTTVDPMVGPWPFTAPKVAVFRERERQRRLAAVAELGRLAAETRPDPDGLTAVDYLRPWRDPDADQEDDAHP